MAKWLTAPTKWIRELFGSSQPSQPLLSSKPMLLTGEEAILAVEGLICETIYRPTAIMGKGDGLSMARSRPDATNAFGKKVIDRFTDGSSSVVSQVNGSALCGIRSSGILPCDGLVEARDQLSAASEHRVPFVLHPICHCSSVASIGANSGHKGYYRLTDTGALLAFAKDAQQAVDLTLLGRSVSELTLSPFVVALDGPECAWVAQQVSLPDTSLIKEFLHEPESEIACPTPAQIMLFGENRRCMPYWFDLDRPVVIGSKRQGQDFAAAIAGQKAFFADHCAQITRDTIPILTSLTGRPLSTISTHRLDDAQYGLVVQGASIEVAEAVADYLRVTKKLKVGVLGLTLLRPFPSEEVKESLRHLEAVTVLDRSDNALSEELPLFQEVKAVVGERDTKLFSACYGLDFQPVTVPQFISVVENMQSGGSARTFIRLGVDRPASGSDFPKQDVYFRSIQSFYTDLGHDLGTANGVVDVRPKKARTVVVCSWSAHASETVFLRLARALSKINGPHIRSRSIRSERGVWIGNITVSPEPMRDPGDQTPIDLIFLTDSTLLNTVRPYAELKQNAAVVVSTQREPDQLWTDLSDAWRAMIREKELSLYIIKGGTEELIDKGVSLLGDPWEGLIEVNWSEMSDPPVSETETEMPFVVQQYGKIRPSYDSVSRFWGEIAQPRIEGDRVIHAPDPLLALGAVPPCTASFVDNTKKRALCPQIDSTKCSGCGQCWVSCSDAAISCLAIKMEALLNAAADQVELRDNPASGKLKRAHRQLASRIDSMIAKSESSALSIELLKEAFEWLLGKMAVGDQDRESFEKAFDATLQGIETLPLSITEKFFFDPHKQNKGSGELLMLAVNPQSCQACGVCASVCPEDAISMVPQTDGMIARMKAHFRAWERLPDTSGETIDRIRQDAEIGGLSAILMSRHCQFSMSGGDGAEAGSGQRLATRQVVAVVEYQMQRRMKAYAEEVESLEKQLRDAIRNIMAESVSIENLGHLGEALQGAPDRPSNLGAVISQLDDLGERTTLDVKRLQRLVRVAEGIQQLHYHLVQGVDSVGRARYGIVIASESIAEWAASFPNNNFCVPVVCDPTENGTELALGLARGLIVQSVKEARLIRHAKLLIEAPTDLSAKEKQLSLLDFHDLTDDELSVCPPLLLIGDAKTLATQGLSGLSAILSSDLPIKVILLESGDVMFGSGHPSVGVDPSLVALAHRTAAVVSSSVAHPMHLFDGVLSSIESVGPAFIQVYSPSPNQQGFPSDRMVERAQMAVESRVRPLLSYSPKREGVFGKRISLVGNKEVASAWLKEGGSQPYTPADWAFSELRFRSEFTELISQENTVPIQDWAALALEDRRSKIPTLTDPEGKVFRVEDGLAQAVVERQQAWLTLQELVGIKTPFTDRLRDEIKQELAQEHQAELEALKAEYRSKLSELETEQLANQAVRLKERLLQLSTSAVADRSSSAKPEG